MSGILWVSQHSIRNLGAGWEVQRLSEGRHHGCPCGKPEEVFMDVVSTAMEKRGGWECSVIRYTSVLPGLVHIPLTVCSLREGSDGGMTANILSMHFYKVLPAILPPTEVLRNVISSPRSWQWTIDQFSEWVRTSGGLKRFIFLEALLHILGVWSSKAWLSINPWWFSF